MTKKIESLQNEKIKQIVKLRDSSRERQTAGRFVIEGYREISLALAGDAEIVNLIYCPDYLKKELAVAEEKIIAVPKKFLIKFPVGKIRTAFWPWLKSGSGSWKI